MNPLLSSRSGIAGSLLLVGAFPQFVGLFVESQSFCCQVIAPDYAPSWFWAAPNLAGAALAAAGGAAVLATRSRLLASAAAGASLVAAFAWLAYMLSPILSEYDGGWDLGEGLWWTGSIGALGAVVAVVGGLLGALPGSVRDVATVGTSPDAGWYPDPAGGGQRWWDGAAWTEQTRG